VVTSDEAVADKLGEKLEIKTMTVHTARIKLMRGWYNQS
jgi:hypothetical protein